MKRGKTKSGSPTGQTAAKEQVRTPQPLRPRKGLFVVMSIIIGIWILTLLVLYGATVYPARHSSSTPQNRPLFSLVG